MAKLVNLKEKPYYLNDDQIKDVESLVLSMSLDDKLKQLFICLTKQKDEEYLKEEMSTTKCGGVRYNPGMLKDVYNHNYFCQKYSEIPVFTCANTEEGGNGAFVNGTLVGCETKIGATHNLKNAYDLGDISAKEAKLAGVNTLFAPIVDIHHNFHNPVISLRTFGNDASLVKDMSLEYLKAVHDNGLLSAAKHFPGDGMDERDQHLAPSINTCSKEEWDTSYGSIYKALIDEGLDMIMAGHIKLPCYESYYSKDKNIKKYKAATVCKELITDLLKEQLDFNGLVLTDATHMVALTCEGKRSELIPNIIASGCDMILFYNDFEEDLKFIKDGYNKGIITETRLNDAIRRILGLKMKLGILNKKVDQFMDIYGVRQDTFMPNKEIGLRVSDESITLIKNNDSILPINSIEYKRILLVPQEDENIFAQFMPKRGKTIYEQVKEMLEDRGFEVTIFESLMDKAKRLPPNEAMGLVMNVYNNKTPIASLTDNYDLVIQFAHFNSHNTVQRISWKLSKGTADIPWYVHELPVIFVSLCCPFHLFDVPQVRTYINCYDKNILTLQMLVKKLCGESTFKGISPVDAFCDSEDCKY